MSKISCLLTDHAIKYDSGIDAGVLTHNFSSMSLDSSDSSYGSSAGDVLNRARMDSMDGDLSIKEELNRARILSQDFTLDGISLSADEDVSETRINVSIKLTNGKQVRNKENVVQSNKYAKLSKSDNKVECRQFVNKKQTNYRYGVINSTDPSPKAKPLSPSKNNCAPYNSPNNTSRAGPKKVNTRKKRTSRNSVSPPKRYQVVNNVTKALNKVSSCSPGLKTSNDTSGSKVTAKSFGANSKYSPVFASCPAKGKKSPYSKEDSIYSTPVQTPSKLHRLATPTLMSPNVTTRSSSPREKILNCKFITVRSTPSPTLPPPPPKKIFPSCSPPPLVLLLQLAAGTVLRILQSFCPTTLVPATVIPAPMPIGASCIFLLSLMILQLWKLLVRERNTLIFLKQ